MKCIYLGPIPRDSDFMSLGEGVGITTLKKIS